MDARSPGPVAAPCLRAQWLPLRRLRTGDTVRAFANRHSALHPVDRDPFGLGIGPECSESSGRKSRPGGSTRSSSVLISLSRP